MEYALLICLIQWYMRWKRQEVMPKGTNCQHRLVRFFFPGTDAAQWSLEGSCTIRGQKGPRFRWGGGGLWRVQCRSSMGGFKNYFYDIFVFDGFKNYFYDILVSDLTIFDIFLHPTWGGWTQFDAYIFSRWVETTRIDDLQMQIFRVVGNH